ncbi:MAG: hypothetical protein IJP92_12625 [Lachnospiraceae bacterium]|nr:hypothetical protein [Lachnospiraceae bacterium]
MTKEELLFLYDYIRVLPDLFHSDSIVVTPYSIDFRDGPEGQSHAEVYYYHQSGKYVLFTDSWQDITTKMIWQFITL